MPPFKIYHFMEVKTTDITCLQLRIGITRILVGSATLTNRRKRINLSGTELVEAVEMRSVIVLRLAQEYCRDAVIVFRLRSGTWSK